MRLLSTERLFGETYRRHRGRDEGGIAFYIAEGLSSRRDSTSHFSETEIIESTVNRAQRDVLCNCKDYGRETAMLEQIQVFRLVIQIGSVGASEKAQVSSKGE